jgi:hypothetical protein
MILKTIFRSAVQLITFPAKDLTAQLLKDVTAGAMFEESHELTLQHPGLCFHPFSTICSAAAVWPQVGMLRNRSGKSDLLYQKDRANFVI